MKNNKRYNKDLKEFKNQNNESGEGFVDYFSKSIEKLDPTYQENDVTLDFNYIYMQMICLKLVENIQRSFIQNNIDPMKSLFLDVGSPLYIALSFSRYFPVIQVDCNLPVANNIISNLPGLNFSCLRSESKDIFNVIKESSVSIITSLHALEHFGLGRYGDKIDYFGDQRCLKTFNMALKDEGILILAVPFSPSNSPRVEFNHQRVYNYNTVDSMLYDNGFDLKEHWFILAFGNIRDDNGNPLSPIVKSKKQIDSVNPDSIDGVGVYITISQKRRDKKEQGEIK